MELPQFNAMARGVTSVVRIAGYGGTESQARDANEDATAVHTCSPQQFENFHRYKP